MDAENKILNLHDGFFRETFGKKNIAKGYLQEQLPTEISRLIDFDTLTITKDSFVDKELRNHFSDLLYRANYKGQDLYLYLLFEHKSYPDHWVSLQLLRYFVKIWEQYRKQNPKEKQLPVIIPLVLYHGRKKWQVATDFKTLIAQTDQCFDEFIPNFKYQLHDLSTLPEEHIRGEVQQRIILLILKNIFNPDLKSKLPTILSLLHEVETSDNIVDLLEVLMRYVVQATKQFDEHEITEILMQSSVKEDIVQTFIDKYIEQGMQQGMQQGIQKGIMMKNKQVFERGNQHLFSTMLTSRFGTIPEWVNEKLSNADTGSIEKWSIKLLSASTVDEVFH